MKIPKPFIPLRVESDNLHHTVHLLNRDYTFGPDGMITSIMSEGHELLAGPVRVVAREDGEDAVWDMNYPDNESESFIQSRLIGPLKTLFQCLFYMAFCRVLMI